jgi:hypothetical protein
MHQSISVHKLLILSHTHSLSQSKVHNISEKRMQFVIQQFTMKKHHEQLDICQKNISETEC